MNISRCILHLASLTMLQTIMKLDTFQRLNFSRPRPGQLSDNIAQFPGFKNMFVSAMLKVKRVYISIIYLLASLKP